MLSSRIFPRKYVRPLNGKLLGLVMAVQLFCSALSYAQSTVMPPPIVEGGRCEYVSYKGFAEIISFLTKKRGERAHEQQVYEMKFRFFPKEEVDFSIEDFVTDREFVEIFYKDGPPGITLTGKDKEDIRAGTVLPCILRKSIRGTCTPSMFVFPTLVEGFHPELDRPKDMRPMSAAGTIIGYDAGKSITIRGTSGKVISLDVSPDAKTRGDIREGARARVMYKKDGDKLVAYSIYFVPTPKKRKE